MNKEEILAAINKTIKGQGSAVDVGGKLAAILEDTLELITSTAEGAPKVYDVDDIEDVPQDICKAVQPGDVVREAGGPSYTVGYKDDSSLYLIIVNDEGARICTYVQEDSEWTLDEVVQPYWNVKPDWNATEGPAAILNKPTIPPAPVIIDAEQRQDDFYVENESPIMGYIGAGRNVVLRVAAGATWNAYYTQVVIGAEAGGCCAFDYDGNLKRIHD